MSNEPQYYPTTFDEDGTKYVLARIARKNSSHAMVAAATSDFTSITRGIYAVPSSTAVVAATTLTTSDVILSATSTGNIWYTDGTGFNFIDTISSTNFASGNQVLQVEYVFTTVSNESWPMRVRGNVLSVEGS